MKVWSTPRARRRALLAGAWWRANRPAAPNLFEQELADAKQRLPVQPNLGHVYEIVGDRMMRRLLLPKSEQHLYYSVDETNETVAVITICGARRGRGPKL